MNNQTILPIYLVSLPQDIERRTALKKQFTHYYDQFVHIQAVDGRKLPAQEYFTKSLPFFKKYNRPMTPAEVGCTLSHIKALETFLKTNATHALILEDDVMGSDENIDAINGIIGFIPQNSLLLCGLLYEEVISDYRYGKVVNPSIPLFQVSKFSYPYVSGTYAYIVTKASAKVILSSHRENLNIADRYHDFFINSDIQIYLNINFKHPDNRAQSSIDIERMAVTIQETIFQKLFAADSPKRIFNFLKLRFRLLIAKLTNEKLPEN